MNIGKKVLLTILLLPLLAVAALTGCGGKASDLTGKVQAFSGNVSIKKTSAADFTKAQVGDKIEVGGILKTAEESQASLEIVDKGVVEIKQNSIFELEQGRDYVSQNSGVAVYKIDKNKDGFKVKTPQGITCVLGTKFMIRILDEMTVVGVEEGRVSVTANNGESKILEAKKKVILQKSGFRGEIADFDLSSDSFNYLQIDGKWVPKE